MLLDFYPVNGGEFPQAIVGIRATGKIRCNPAMVTSTEDTLQLQFDSATFSDLAISFLKTRPSSENSLVSPNTMMRSTRT